MEYDPVFSPPDPDQWTQFIRDAKSDNTLAALRKSALDAYRHFQLSDKANDAEHPLHLLWNDYLNAIDTANSE
jgi:hypothetical protein